MFNLSLQISYMIMIYFEVHKSHIHHAIFTLRSVITQVRIFRMFYLHAINVDY